MLFDDISRLYTGPAEYGEGSFSYYNRSGRPEVARVRSLIEEWLTGYPADARDELAGRLRTDYRNFDAAFFELYIHTLLTASGYNVSVHPEIPGHSKRPDFLAAMPDLSHSIYVEAVLAAAESSGDVQEGAHHDQIQDDINRFRNSNFFFVIVTLTGVAKRYPSRKALHKFLQSTVEGLDRDEVSERMSRGEDISKHLLRRFVHEGLTLELYPLPKSAGARGDPSYRSVGAGPVRVIRSEARAAIRDAVKAKAGRYGSLPHPYLIAVNCTGRWGVEENEVQEALFGQEEAYYQLEGAGIRFAYSGYGALFHQGKPINTRVSAVLGCRDVTPHSVNRDSVTLIHHPAAALPYAGPLDRLNSLREKGGVLVPTREVNVSELFGLHRDWPYNSGEDPRANRVEVQLPAGGTNTLSE